MELDRGAPLQMTTYNLPITVVINNDKQWGMSKHGQEIMWGKGRHMATELGMVHYERAIYADPLHSERQIDGERLDQIRRLFVQAGAKAGFALRPERIVVRNGVGLADPDRLRAHAPRSELVLIPTDDAGDVSRG